MGAKVYGVGARVYGAGARVLLVLTLRLWTLDLGLGLDNNRLSSENFMQKKMVLSVTKDKVS